MHDIRDGIFFDVIFIEMNGDELKNTDMFREIGYNGEIVLCSQNSVINISPTPLHSVLLPLHHTLLRRI